MVDQKKKSKFAEPLFYTFLEKWLQIKWLQMSIWGCEVGKKEIASLVSDTKNFEVVKFQA